MPDRVSLGRVHHRREYQGVKNGPGGSAGLVGGATTTTTTTRAFRRPHYPVLYCIVVELEDCVSLFVNGNHAEMRNIAEYGISNRHKLLIMTLF